MKDKEKLEKRRGKSRDKIIEAAAEVISRDGIEALTVRRVCTEAQVTNGSFYHYFSGKDDLLAEFVMVRSFADVDLICPVDDIAGRVIELYGHLIGRYLRFGHDFMTSFYVPGNAALSSYMGQTDGLFAPGTVMQRCEDEVSDAILKGILPNDIDAHLVSEDVCTIVKGIVFEYCLSGAQSDPIAAMERLVRAYFKGLVAD